MAAETTDTSKTTTRRQGIAINPATALGEQNALVRFLQNRNLILAQQLHEAKTMVEQLTAALEAAETRIREAEEYFREEPPLDEEH